MTKQILLAMTIWLMLPQAATCQATMEWGMGAGTAGLGAGLGARMNQKRGAQPSAAGVGAALPTEVDFAKYVSAAAKHEAAKQWHEAEECYRSALKTIALREGPGSIKSLPIVQHLVKVTKEQGNYSDAISFQKTLVTFAGNSGPAQVEKERHMLGKLYALNRDYAQAEPLLKSAVEAGKTRTDIPQEEQLETMRAYSKVLHKLNKADEASQIDAEIEKISAPAAPAAQAKQ